MAAAFLHGIEVTETTVGANPVTVVRSAVIGLVGAAPIFMQPGVPPPWNPQGSYAVGAKVLDANMNVQQCIVAGVTSQGAPAWPTTVGGTIVDGTVTWQLVQLANAAPNGVGSLNQAVLVNSSNDAGNFGLPVQGYYMAYAMQQIQEQGSGQIVAVNVLNPSVHYTSVGNVALTLPASGAQVLNLGHMGVFNLVVKNSGVTILYTYGTDYTVDWVNGVISIPAGSSITVGEALSIGYSYVDPTRVTSAQIIGAVSGGVYTGMQCFLTAYQQMGFFPKLLIAPGFSQNQNVAQALDAIAQKIRATAYVDAAPGTVVSAAIANRGVTTSAFYTSSKRSVLCFPQQVVTDTGIVPTGVTLNPAGLPIQNSATGNAEMPLSPFWVGITAATDINNGYWWSPSNKQITGSQGPDVPMYASAFDANSDTNQLNSEGIATVFNGFGTGLRTWGNRSAAYPTYTSPDVFIAIRRTLDVVEESLQIAALQYSDQPINTGWIATVLNSGNAFVRSLVQRGALIAGSAVSYNTGDNPPTQLAAGQVVFEIDLMVPPPAERITYNFVLDTTLLANIGPPQSTSTVA